VPGLAIRIADDIMKEKLDLPHGSDAVHLDELRRADPYDETCQPALLGRVAPALAAFHQF